MKPKDFARLMARDGGCLHCGLTEAVSPNHRANRGMGGSKVRDVPSNLVVLCSWLNGVIESDAQWAAVARSYGWKLNTWQNPLEVPVYDARNREWLLLDDHYGAKVVSQEGKL